MAAEEPPDAEAADEEPPAADEEPPGAESAGSKLSAAAKRKAKRAAKSAAKQEAKSIAKQRAKRLPPAPLKPGSRDRCASTCAKAVRST